MPRLTDIDLPLLPVEQPEMAGDPAPYLEAARQHHEWLARTNVGGNLSISFSKNYARKLCGNWSRSSKLQPPLQCSM